MNYSKIIFIILVKVILLSTPAFAQSAYTLEGQVISSQAGEPLVGANVYLADSSNGATTNGKGLFVLQVQKSRVRLTVSFTGYQDQTVQVSLPQNDTLQIVLQPVSPMQPVTITGKPAFNRTDLSIAEVERLPAILGEPDVMSAVQQLSGVQFGIEGISTINVRGGSHDQNLFLMEDMKIYNTGHIMGLFSAFNPGVVQSVNLYKGGFPAQYGERLSSVMQVNLKDGNKAELHGSGAIGLLSTRLSLEGPIKEGRTSFVVGGRRTYFDALLWPVFQIADVESRGGYFFHDLNGKIHHLFTDGSELTFNIYYGKDQLFYKTDYDFTYTDPQRQVEESHERGFQYHNLASSVNWQKPVNDQLKLDGILSFSRYNFSVYQDKTTTIKRPDSTTTTSEDFNYPSGINEIRAMPSVSYKLNSRHTLQGGLSYSFQWFQPVTGGSFSYETDNIYTSGPEPDATPVEGQTFSGFISDQFSIAAFSGHAGLRWDGYKTNSTFYHYLSPRLDLTYRLNSKWKMNINYVRTTQYQHRLAFSNLQMPTEQWVPSTDAIAPAVADQAGAGATYQLKPGIQLKTQVFYKYMQQLLHYKEGAGPGRNWQEAVTQGEGEAYGLEISVSKKSGQTSGQLSYTLAKATRKFDQLNEGKRFPFKFDRRHSVNLSLTHTFNPKFDVGLTGIFATGNPFTFALQEYGNFQQYTDRSSVYNENFFYSNLAHYSSRNNVRLPAYHRVDLAFHFHKDKSWGKRTWSTGLYNAYFRKNAFALVKNYRTNGIDKLSLLPILPFVKYRFEF